MIKLFQSQWFAGGFGTVLYLVATVFFWHPVRPNVSELETPQPHKAGPSWTFHNPEVEQLIGELKKELEANALKEKQLNELALRLKTERQELNQVTQAVHELQMEFDRNVVRIEEQESANLKKLAKMYATMAPENAVQIMNQMDETTLVKILALMKDTETAPILEAMGKQNEAEAKRAATLSERLRLTLPKPLNGQSPGR
jgi:flagellar motility protein MotE (MotC chaperone)